MNSSDTKTCHACAEEIKQAAYICPRCRQWQRKWSALNPALTIPIFFACFCILGIAFIVAFNTAFAPKPVFEGFRNDVFVTSSAMHFGTKGSNRIVVVIGTLTNRSAVTWKNIELDCRYFNDAGELIDVRNALTSLVVLGHDEIAFRVETDELRPRSDYAKHQAAVRHAVNGRAWGW
jgi:hypothetical protein